MRNVVKYFLVAVSVILLIGVVVFGVSYASKRMKTASDTKAAKIIDKLDLATEKDADQARSALVSAYNKENDSTRKADYALSLATSLKKSNPKDAIGWYEKAVLNKPDGYSFLNLGLAYRKVGNKPQAVVAFRKSLEAMKTEKRGEEDISIVTDLITESEK